MKGRIIVCILLTTMCAASEEQKADKELAKSHVEKAPVETSSNHSGHTNSDSAVSHQENVHLNDVALMSVLITASQILVEAAQSILDATTELNEVIGKSLTSFSVEGVAEAGEGDDQQKINLLLLRTKNRANSQRGGVDFGALKELVNNAKPSQKSN